MTKREHIQAKQASPLGEEGIDAIRKIVAEKQYAKVNHVAVDLFSAGTLITVYDRVNPESQAKIRAMTVPRAIHVAFKTLERAGKKP